MFSHIVFIFYFLKLYFSIFLILSWLKISLCNFFSLYIHLNGVGNHCSPTPKINVDYNSNPQCIPLFFLFFIFLFFFAFFHFFPTFPLFPFFFNFPLFSFCFLHLFFLFFPKLFLLILLFKY